jgi:hypothetical protein
MNIKGLLFYFSLFLHKKDQNQRPNYELPLYILKSVTVKKINKSINQFTKKIKNRIGTSSLCAFNDYANKDNDMFIMNLTINRSNRRIRR